MLRVWCYGFRGVGNSLQGLGVSGFSKGSGLGSFQPGMMRCILDLVYCCLNPIDPVKIGRRKIIQRAETVWVSGIQMILVWWDLGSRVIKGGSLDS